ncbi:MAG: hypothetical protein IJ604_08125 [Prevotella sp.]|nr:hypothetical protein [Prevotella sp.]
MKRIYLFSIVSMLTLCTWAQDELMTKEKYQFAEETQLWRLTLNAAGLSLDSSMNRGITQFDASHREGDYSLVQDGDMNNQLKFIAERYQKVGKYLYGYGSFNFDMGRTKNRAWSDVIRSHNSNPFISGSSVPGKYDHQFINLEAALATVPLGAFTYGMGINYQVGDLSRLRDPRSRINLADYRITPALTYSIGNSSIGLALHYDRHKEKLPNLTTVQTDPSLKYYTMTGMESASGIIGGYNGYEREYVNHELGGELSLAVKGETFHSLNSISFDKGTEYMYGDTKYEPGRYFTYHYKAASRNRFNVGNTLMRADIAASYEQGYADEYRQELTRTKDPQTGIESKAWNTTMTYKKRFQLKIFDLDFHYRASFTENNEVNAYVGMLYNMNHVRNKRILNTSTLKYIDNKFALEGGFRIGRSLWVEAQADYKISSEAELNLHDNSTEYAQAVLIPDMEYYGANYWRTHLQVEYQIPVSIKGYKGNWFARVYGDYLKTNKHTDASVVGCSVGIYY